MSLRSYFNVPDKETRAISKAFHFKENLYSENIKAAIATPSETIETQIEYCRSEDLTTL